MTWISRRLQQASGGSQGSSQSQVHPLWTQSWRHLVAAFHLCFTIIENGWRRCSWLVYQPRDFSHHSGCQSALCCSSHPTPAVCEVSTSASPAPTSLTSCGPTLSLPCWPPHPFLAPLGLPVGTPHSSETSRSLHGRTWEHGNPPSWAFPVVKTGPLSVMLLVSSSPTLPTVPASLFT